MNKKSKKKNKKTFFLLKVTKTKEKKTKDYATMQV